MLELKDYCHLFKDALNRNETIILSCCCRVRYSGRAESLLDTGDRIILVKSDKALLVHQPTGNAPTNYMKPNSEHSLVISDEGKLLLKSKNLEIKEFMDIEIDRIYFFNAHKLEDSQTITVSGTEEDMSQMIYEDPSVVEKGLKPVSKEEQTLYGFIDVLCTDKDGILTVIECKRYSADFNAVMQLRRYVERIKETKGIDKVRGFIAAPKITPNAEQMLKNWGFSFTSVKPPKYLEEFDKKQMKLDCF